MTIGDILVSNSKANLDNLLPLTEVRTREDIKRYSDAGYGVGMTVGEFASRYPLLPIDHIYVAFNRLSSLYYCEPDNPVVPIVLSLQIYGDHRLQVGNLNDEQFQQHILNTAERLTTNNAAFIRTYIYSLEDSFRVSVLSKYIKQALPSPELYSLFTNIYRSTDYGFGGFDKGVLGKVFAGKSEEQKAETAVKLANFPDKVTLYRGEGSKSTPYKQSFSWTTSFRAACFFACRLPSAENSRIITTEVAKRDIVEYFPKSSEKEVLVPPDAVKEVKIDTLYGINALAREASNIMPIYQCYRQRITELYEEYGCADEAGHDAEHTLRVLFDALLLVQIQKINLTQEETYQLCDAVLYHDIGRTNDSVDDGHGKASRQIYLEDTIDDDPAVGFLIQYHCIDDDVAYADLESSEMPDKDRVWLLYTILKDADALDRVRFGLRELNPKYLRNKMAHKLLPVAQSCVGQLNL